MDAIKPTHSAHVSIAYMWIKRSMVIVSNSELARWCKGGAKVELGVDHWSVAMLTRTLNTNTLDVE